MTENSILCTYLLNCTLLSIHLLSIAIVFIVLGLSIIYYRDLMYISQRVSETSITINNTEHTMNKMNEYYNEQFKELADGLNEIGERIVSSDNKYLDIIQYLNRDGLLTSSLSKYQGTQQ